MRAKIPDEDPTSAPEAATAAVAASASDVEEGSGSEWHAEEDFDPEGALEMINSRSALPGAGSVNLCVFRTYSQSSGLASGAGSMALVLRFSGDESSTIEAPFHRSSGSFAWNPTSLLWRKTASPYA